MELNTKMSYTQYKLLDTMIINDEYEAIKRGISHSSKYTNGDYVLINCGVHNEIITYSYLHLTDNLFLHQMQECQLEDFNYDQFAFDTSPFKTLYLPNYLCPSTDKHACPMADAFNP